MGGEGYPVTMAIAHPKFDRDSDVWPYVVNDIGLLILGRPVPSTITPLPLSPQEPWFGMAINIVGLSDQTNGPYSTQDLQSCLTRGACTVSPA